MTMNYEIFYLIGASLESDLARIKKDVEDIISEKGGIFEEKELEEKKRLAYRVSNETNGFYVARRFSIDPENLKEINQKLNLYSNILRFMINKTSDLPDLKSKEELRELKPAIFEKEKSAVIKKKEYVDTKNAKDKTPSFQERTPKDEQPEIRDKKTAEEDIDKKLEEILNI